MTTLVRGPKSLLKRVPFRLLPSLMQLRKTHVEDNFLDVGDNDPYHRTSVTVLNKEVEYGIMVDSFSSMGFRLNNGIRVFGSMAVFPRSVLCWNVINAKSLNEDAFSLFCLLEPKIDILVLGVGDPGEKVDPKVLQHVRSKRISLEVLPTDIACATFNFLNSEGRYVAGALIPPKTITFTDDDIVMSQERQKKLHSID